nr:hypothetical protein [Sphingomonas bacterium]
MPAIVRCANDALPVSSAIVKLVVALQVTLMLPGGSRALSGGAVPEAVAPQNYSGGELVASTGPGLVE